MTINNTLYIPTTTVVGFQNRNDTFTGKLGYVIYKDHTGKLRKEKSWQGWRDHSIDPLTFENTPQTGFTFNKGITRGGYDWFSDTTTKVRVWDPRDFEFEISVGNLIALLMHSDVSKRDIQQPCVYAWAGTELVLLPTNSEEYQQSVKYTDKQKMKFSARDLVIGHTYTPKKDKEDVVYLGRLDQYKFVYRSDEHESEGSYLSSLTTEGYSKLDKAKQHVFMGVTSGQVHIKNPSSYLAFCASQEVIPQLASMLDQYYHLIQSQPISGIKLGTAVHHDYTPSDSDAHGYASSKNLLNTNIHNWIQINETDFASFDINPYMYLHQTRCVSFKRFARYDADTNTVQFSHGGRAAQSNSWIYSHRYPAIAERPLEGLSATMPEVVRIVDELGKRMMSIGQEIEGVRSTGKNYYEIQSEMQLATSKALEEFKLNSLTVVMADGKVCSNLTL